MDELAFGQRDRRGNWRPKEPARYPELFSWPIQWRTLARWLFGYPGFLLPWNAIYGGAAILVWLLLTPPVETLQTLAPGWILFVLLRNVVLTTVFFGAFHLHLYGWRKQSDRFKYNPAWQAKDNPRFLFKNQVRDNVFWSLVSGVTIWTAYEVITLWVFANGYVPWISLEAHPLWFLLVFLSVPLMRDVHFYFVHRLLHIPAIYKRVHRLHHHNTNPGPWSGLAMHPIEHLLYFSGVLIHWILPSHPVHALFHLFHAGLAPAPGHTGFHKVELADDRAVDTNALIHYLHHKYFECNYGGGVVPLDRWFGTFHDGSEQAHQRMRQRLRERDA